VCELEDYNLNIGADFTFQFIFSKADHLF